MVGSVEGETREIAVKIRGTDRDRAGIYMSGQRLPVLYRLCPQPGYQSNTMAYWELQPEDLSRWNVLNSCQPSFLNEIRLVCFSGESQFSLEKN